MNFFIERNFWQTLHTITLAKIYKLPTVSDYFLYYNPVHRSKFNIIKLTYSTIHLYFYNNNLKQSLLLLKSILFYIFKNNVQALVLMRNINFATVINYLYLCNFYYIFCNFQALFNFNNLAKFNKFNFFFLLKNILKVNVIFFFINKPDKISLKFIRSQLFFTIGLASPEVNSNAFSYNIPYILNFNFSLFFFKNISFDIYKLSKFFLK